MEFHCFPSRDFEEARALYHSKKVRPAAPTGHKVKEKQASQLVRRSVDRIERFRLCVLPTDGLDASRESDCDCSVFQMYSVGRSSIGLQSGE